MMMMMKRGEEEEGESFYHCQVKMSNGVFRLSPIAHSAATPVALADQW